MVGYVCLGLGVLAVVGVWAACRRADVPPPEPPLSFGEWYANAVQDRREKGER